MFARLEENRRNINKALYPADRRKNFSPACFAECEVTLPALRRHLRGACLDVGAGDAPYRPLVSDCVTSYDTFDVEPRDVELTYRGDAQSMTDVPSKRYDSVMSLEVLEHVPRPDLAAAELFRVLKPGGVLVCSVPHLSRLHEEPNDYHRFTAYGLRHLLERSGFEILEISRTGGLACFVGHQVSSILLVPFWHVPVARQLLFVVNRFLLVRPAYVLDRWIDRAGKFALGYVCVARRPDVDESRQSRP